MKKKLLMMAVTVMLVLPVILACSLAGAAWSNPVWNWNDDYSAASVTLTDENGETMTIDATVTKTEIMPTTCTQDGKIRYFASAQDDSGTWVDWKTVTVPATGHDWGTPVWTWSDDCSTASVTLTCKNNSSETKTIEATVTKTVIMPATCGQDGKVRYFASAQGENGSTWVDWKTVTVPATEHDWGSPVWTWSDDCSTASVTLTCKNDASHTTTIEATVTKTEIMPTTCTQDGKVRYFASAPGDNGSTWVDWKTVTVPATGHDWGSPVWTWSDDCSTASVTLTCKNNSSETKTIEATVTKTELMPTTCYQDGKVRYFASAQGDNGSTWVDWKTVTVPATAHDWGSPVWSWTGNNTTATVTLTCRNDPSHTKTIYATITKTEIMPVTCTQDGKVRYFASAQGDNGSTWVDWKTVTVPATGHDWVVTASQEATYTEEGFTEYTCSRCGETRRDVIPAIPDPAAKYTDLPPVTSWKYPGVVWAIRNGILEGTSEDKVEADRPVTRAQVASFFYRLAGSPEVTSSTNNYSDVSSDAWYSDSVTWASENGIIVGPGSGEFGLNDSVTREQFAAILCRYSKYAGNDVSARADLSSYSDAGSISAYAKPAMSWAVASGYIAGTDKTHLSPKSTVTRAQVVAILMRYSAANS